MLNIITFHFLCLILVLMLIVPSGYALSKLDDSGGFTILFVGLLAALDICFGILLVIVYIFGGS